MALGMLTATSCKKKNPCKEEWPEGFEFFETTSGEAEASCTTPIMRGKYKTHFTGQRHTYQMLLTPQQGVAEIQLNADVWGHFQAPRTYTLNTGNTSNEPHQMFIDINQQWTSEDGLYWHAFGGSCTLEKLDTIAGTVSLTLEYDIAPVGSTTNAKNYRVELTDYPMPWNPG